jgi:uncharacterized protein with HEPN domain
VNRSANERLTDILAAIDRTLTYRPRLDDPDPSIAAMAYDAVLRNLAVIGEAVRALPDQVKTRQPDVPWASIAGLRNVVVHEYFRVDPTLITDIIDNDLTALAHAAQTRLPDAQ